MMQEERIISRLYEGKTPEKEELMYLLNTSDARGLFIAADRVRKENTGDGVHLRALIEFSNFCKNDCLYCGIRRSNTCAHRYRLSAQEIMESASLAASCGYKTVVLQSGEDVTFGTDKICEIIKEIKKLDMAVTLSIGEKTRGEYAAYRQAGADRYLLRIETTNKILYEKLDPSMSWDNRVRCLYDLKDLGFEVGSGSLVGLPEQTIDSLAEDLLFFKKLSVDMAGIGPFIPHPQTPLADAPAINNFEISLKMMALMRLLLPDINIPATTAMESLHPHGRMIALQCGANVIMPNLTAEGYREKYELYPNKSLPIQSARVYKEDLAKKLKSIGRYIAEGYGFHNSNHLK